MRTIVCFFALLFCQGVFGNAMRKDLIDMVDENTPEYYTQLEGRYYWVQHDKCFIKGAELYVVCESLEWSLIFTTHVSRLGEVGQISRITVSVKVKEKACGMDDKEIEINFSGTAPCGHVFRETESVFLQAPLPPPPPLPIPPKPPPVKNPSPPPEKNKPSLPWRTRKQEPA